MHSFPFYECNPLIMHVCPTCVQDLFIQSLQSVGLYTESVQEMLEVLFFYFFIGDCLRYSIDNTPYVHFSLENGFT